MLFGSILVYKSGWWRTLCHGDMHLEFHAHVGGFVDHLVQALDVVVNLVALLRCQQEVDPTCAQSLWSCHEDALENGQREARACGGGNKDKCLVYIPTRWQAIRTGDEGCDSIVGSGCLCLLGVVVEAAREAFVLPHNELDAIADTCFGESVCACDGVWVVVGKADLRYPEVEMLACVPGEVDVFDGDHRGILSHSAKLSLVANPLPAPALGSVGAELDVLPDQ